MSKEDRQQKRPSGGRPLVRRLFSTDSTRSAAEKQVHSRSASAARGAPTTPLREESPDDSDPFADALTPPTPPRAEAWTDNVLTSSPKSEEGSFAWNPRTQSEASSSSDNGPRALPAARGQRKPSGLSFSKTASISSSTQEDIPRSPSLRRWETLRKHVLQESTEESPPSTPRLPTLTPNRPSSPASSSRPGTPSAPLRQFRLPRRFRQVVEQAQEVSSDSSRRFADDVLRAILAARTIEPRVPKREGTTPFNMTFMSTTTTLPSSANASTANLAYGGRFGNIGLRRAPSISSIPSSPAILPASGALHALLSQYSAATSSGAAIADEPLPHEADVLALLLAPFLVDDLDPNVLNARWQSIETFQTIVKTWPSVSHEIELQRCFWCCKAAAPAVLDKDVRARVLGALSSTVFAPGVAFRAESPIVLQTLLQALFSLLASLSALDGAYEEASLVRELIVGALHGACGDLEPSLVLQDFGAKMRRSEDVFVKDCVVVQALSSCLELEAPAHRPYIAEALSEDFWVVAADAGPHPKELSPLIARTLARCAQSILHYLPQPDAAVLSVKRAHVLRLVRNRLVPHAESLADEFAAEPRMLVARIALRMLCMHDTAEQEEARVLLAQWQSLRQSPWTAAVESALRQMMQEESWSSSTAVCLALVDQLSDDFRLPAIAAFLPALNERLVNDPPQLPSPTLTELLETVAHDYPKLFYKPMFALAAASKDTTLANHLRVVAQLSRIVRGFWIADIEMLLVGLMSNSTVSSGSSRRPRLGQLILTMELTAYVISLSHAPKDKTTEAAFATAAKFLLILENRLGALLNVTDSATPIPQCHRVALITMFLEIRLCLKTLRPAHWLPSLVSWLSDDGAPLEAAQLDVDPDTAGVFDRLEKIYSEAQTRPHALGHKHRPSAVVMSHSASSNVNGGLITGLSHIAGHTASSTDSFATLQDRLRLLGTMRRGLTCNGLALLVACSGLLTVDDYNRLNNTLWQTCLGTRNPFIQARAAFLLMQSAEKTDSHLLDVVRENLSSSNSSLRQQAANRLGVMLGWRYQLLSQKYITDTKTYRRPFKYARGPIAFLATDMGSSSFVLEDKEGVLKASNGTVIPAELRKRLADIGWALDIEVGDRKEELVKTPLSLVATQHMDHAEGDSPMMLSRPSSPSPSPEPSSFAAAGVHAPVKRRPIVVPAIASMLSELAYHAFDDDLSVSSSARSILLDIMRDDPALISRPVLDAFSGGEKEMLEAVRAVQAFAHVHRSLPPALSHHILNHIVGFLKTASRRSDAPISAFAFSLPVLAELSPHVSNFSIRDVRRAKVEQLLVPSGSLWFGDAAPLSSMFPRSLADAVKGARSTAKEKLTQITMIRTSQNLLFLDMLKRHPQDVVAIRKNMSRLVLPAYSDAFDFAVKDMYTFIPKRRLANTPAPSPDADLEGLSLVLSRSHVLLVQAVLKAMPRHLNDRAELQVLVDGLNKILLAHGDDIGIVAHVLIAFMIASTRFRRIFSSSGGYTMFMPAVLKVYAEMENNEGIRAAIEYAVNRFYAVYQEAFVFQTLDILSHLTTFTNDADCGWFSGQVYSLLHSLRDGAPLLAPDYAGIHNANRAEEQEALLIYAAEQKPQALFSLLKRERSARGGEKIDIAVPEEYETVRLSSDNLVRLFLTVIGHDPGIRRAENFLRLLRFLAPDFSADPQAHVVLKGGIEALGTIFLSRSTSNKQKVPEAAQLRTQDEASRMVYAASSSNFHGESRSPSDLAQMRLDYLSLVVAFTKAGGELDYSSAAGNRVMELSKLVLKDAERDRIAMVRMSSFFADYTEGALLRSTPPKLKHILAFLGTLLPIYKAHSAILDFSGVLSVLLKLSRNPLYGNELVFARVIVDQFCATGLDALELAGSSGMDMLPMEPVLVQLLSHATLMRGVDVIGLLERRAPSYALLSRILLPLAIAIPTTREVTRDSHWPRNAPAHAMARLTLLVMAQCEGTTPAGRPVLVRSNSRDKRRSTSSREDTTSAIDAASLLAMLLQIMKVIVLRAGDEISVMLPGIWLQLGQLLKRVLADGDASFALSENGDSVPNSPISTADPDASLESNSNPFAPSRTASPVGTSNSLARPRVVDYLLWSMLEFAGLHRSPLITQLRPVMQVGAARLDDALRVQVAPSPRGRRLSVFAKPRIRSGMYSGGTTPETSPYLRAADATPGSRPGSFNLGSGGGLTLSLPITPERTPGYARSAGPSPARPGAGPRIVHLGPVQRSPSGGGIFRRGSGGPNVSTAPTTAARITKVRSAALVRATYRRIRVVQQMMGYTLLLPLAEGEGEDALGEARTWTRREALEAVARETKELQEEFGWNGGGDWDYEGVIVTEDLSFTSLGS